MSGAGSVEMPKYRCHKVVHALKIKSIEPYNAAIDLYGPGKVMMAFEDPTYAPMEIQQGFWQKHKPAPGGYYVVYEDGYASWSPAEAFESGYTRI